MILHKTLGSGISGTVRYVMGEGKRDPETGKVPELAPGAQSRVAWYGGTGFGFPIDSEVRLDLARRVMEWAAENQASKTKRCRDDCLHLVLAWDPEERPPRDEMEAAARSALKHLGMEHARALFVAHDDTAHRHLHLVISRIDPLTGKAFSDSFDTIALSAWALQWERDHGGVRCEARLDREKSGVERDPEQVLAAYIGRRETFTVFDLNRELTAAIPSRETRRAFVSALLTRPEIVTLTDPTNGQAMRYTTRQTLAAEHIASGSAERLAADMTHRVTEAARQKVIEQLRIAGKELRPDQMEAWQHATGAAGLAVIAGKAGTGKTFCMTAIAAAYQAQGYQVQSLAPTNKVVAALKRDGLDAATLHSMLGRLDRGQVAWTDRSLVMVDEAGMVSTRLMARLLSHAEHAGAKVVLIGDDKQLASMQRGGMFGYLAAEYGAGGLDEITRQRGAEQRELAQRASRYDFRAALSALDAQGRVAVCPTSDERVATAAALWAQRSAATPDSSLFVITVSNADAQAVNLAIRDIRRGRSDLGPDRLLPTADGLQAFAEGDRILFSGTAATREGRSAGLVNGNAGTIKAIAQNRVTVALDGSQPGETVSFRVGSDHAAGAFDAIRHGYAGTIYKAQGATYDHAIVVDSPMMRASSGYVALTRHRESVTVVTSPDLHQGPVGWQSRKGGLDALPQTQRAAAERSYAAWTVENPAAGQRHDLAAYVGYVQARDAKRRAEIPANDAAVTAMVRDWSRIEDRRAASRFTPVDYEAPTPTKLTPDAVRAAVGVEPSGDTISLAQPHEQAANENRKLRPTPEPTREPRPMLEGPTDDELRKQPERETAYIDHLKTRHERAEAMLTEQRRAQELDDRAKAFQADKEREAEEGRRKQGEQEAAEAREGHNGDISSAAARYSIAIGQTYDVRDPYASLGRAAGSEAAMFHRSQEELKAAAAKETDPDKRQAIELRRKIEGCDYMAITSERLAGIAVTVTGRADNEYSVKDRQQAAHYRAMAAGLREERGTLLEAVQAKGVTVEIAKDQVTEQVAGQAQGQGAAGPRARADTQPPYRTAMPATAPAPASPAPAPIAAEPEPVVAPAFPVREQAASAVEKAAAARQADPPRLTAQGASASFGTVSFKPYAVAMPTSTITPPQAAISATAPYDVKPTPIPDAKAKAPDLGAAPAERPKATTRRVVEASAADYLAAKAAGIVTRPVSTPSAEATQTKGVTKTVEVTDRKAAASGAQQGTVRKVTGIDRDQEPGNEPGGGRRR